MDCTVTEMDYKFIYIEDGPEPTEYVNLKILDKDCRERNHIFTKEKIEDLHVLISNILDDIKNKEIDIEDDILEIT